ncbi:hypothetical protein NI17_011370 [Thermobifida halotolerans]|uniref:Uncharacterized protein n=1 Tax=Thermobifida halotolerans TaxID=483545 RepID=A0A399G976_9ACTN|nr:hypothetical protein [Thermobifida halotolerans]UOE21639.1 hypothetical protein NI17_011370 [Thermobifida halotolerans]
MSSEEYWENEDRQRTERELRDAEAGLERSHAPSCSETLACTGCLAVLLLLSFLGAMAYDIVVQIWESLTSGGFSITLGPQE